MRAYTSPIRKGMSFNRGFHFSNPDTHKEPQRFFSETKPANGRRELIIAAIIGLAVALMFCLL